MLYEEKAVLERLFDRRKKSIAAEFGRRFSRLLFRAAFVFEPLAPQLISYYLAQRLDSWKQKGLILASKTRTKRLGKFHYKTQIDLDMNGEQAARVLDDFIRKLKRAGR